MILAAALALAAAACGGSSEPRASTTGSSTQTGSAAPVATPEAAGVLGLFVQAAGRGDAEAMWGLLTTRSQRALGPTLTRFEKKRAKGFETGLGSFAGTGYDVLLSEMTSSGWAIAAIAGERTRRGKREYAAYAAMLAREGNGWRLELGDPLRLELLSPRHTRTETQPLVAFRAAAEQPIRAAGLWLDGTPLPGRVRGSGATIEVTGKPAQPLAVGRHVVIVFASTGNVASAGAAPFRISGGPTA